MLSALNNSSRKGGRGRHHVEERICTLHVERQNLHMRMQLRRFTRLTNAFSRKRENLGAALAVHFTAFNLCWMHRKIRCTPAMGAAGLVLKPWTVRGAADGLGVVFRVTADQLLPHPLSLPPLALSPVDE